MSSLPVAILLGDRLGSMHAALSPVPMARELAGCQRLRVPSKYLGCQMSQPFAMSIKLASPLFPGLSALACTCFDRVVPRTKYLCGLGAALPSTTDISFQFIHSANTAYPIQCFCVQLSPGRCHAGKRFGSPFPCLRFCLG